MTNPLLSIVTINYNNRNELFRTIAFVTYWRKHYVGMIEHILIDGNSDDLDSYDKARLAQLCEVFISERDDGIYDAMNKGLRSATGDYVYFLNSGDFVIKLDVILKRICSAITKDNKSVLAFRSLQTFGNVGWVRPRLSHLSKLCVFPAHQATVVPLKETRGIEFDISKTISGDSLWMSRCIQKVSVQIFPDVVAMFQLGGVSNRATFVDQFAIYKDSPSLGRLFGVFLKPILLKFLGYKYYYKLIYFQKYMFAPNVYIYLEKLGVDNCLIEFLDD
jgi:glycosyltransferase involved in cell wall biosynthesis